MCRARGRHQSCGRDGTPSTTARLRISLSCSPRCAMWPAKPRRPHQRDVPGDQRPPAPSPVAVLPPRQSPAQRAARGRLGLAKTPACRSRCAPAPSRRSEQAGRFSLSWRHRPSTRSAHKSLRNPRVGHESNFCCQRPRRLVSFWPAAIRGAPMTFAVASAQFEIHLLAPESVDCRACRPVATARVQLVAVR